MSQLIINTNKGTADSLKTGAIKINSNFTELYAILANNPPAIPALAGNSGKYLTTNGTAISWQTVQATDGVVTTGSYANPSWITSLDYLKLTNKPNLAGYLTAGSLSVSTISPSGNGALSYSGGIFTYTPPSLAAVATSGSYTDLTNKPTITAIPTQTANTGKYLTTDGSSLSWGTISTDYNNLTNKPTIPAAQIQSDWTQASNIALDYIKNKPTIPAAQVQSDWNAVSGLGVILNKPTLFGGSYDDLTNKPAIPAAYSATSINALSDVDTVTSVPTAGQPLVWNAVTSSWVPGSIISGSLSTLSGVIITSPQVGQVLKYNGSAWENDADSVSGGAGVGTVTNVSVTSANGFTGTVATSSSTPAITIGTSITGMLRGTGTAITAATAGTDYQSPISLTTTGSTGAATFSSNVLNIPQYGNAVGPATATDNAITRFDATTGKLLQNSVVTISDLGAIVAPIASSIIPFHYDDQAGFPSATTYHGAIAHSHADGKMYFAHSGTWLALANASDIPAAQSVTGIVKSSGTTLSAATSGTDYAPGTSALVTGIVKSTTTTGALTIAVAGTDYQAPVSATGILKSSGVSGNVSAAVAGTDYQSAQSVTGIVKSSGTTRSAAVAGTDYQAPISATGILKSSGVSGNVSAAVAGTDYQAAQSVTGIVKSSGTTRSAAVAGTDYQAPVSATGILKSSGVSGNVSAAVAGTDYQAAQSVTGIVKSSGTTRSAAVAGTDYQAPIGTISGIVKGNGANALTAATAGTDYQAPVSATGILKSSGVSGNVSAATAGTDYQAPITLTTTGSSGAATFSSGTLNIPQYSVGSSSNSFETIVVAGQTSIVADSSTDSLTLVAGTGISITTNATTDTVTITSTVSSGATAFSGLSDATSASLTVDKIYLPAITMLAVTNNGATAYRFDQYGTTDDPTIYVISGTTIAFNLSVSGHPFLIRTSGGVNYNDGLVHVSTTGTVSTGASAQGQVAGTLYWKIPAGTTGTYQYICSIHSGMVGVITIKDISAI